MSAWKTLPYAEWTDQELLDCAQWWAAELGLNSWVVSAVFRPRYEVEALARCTYNARTERVHIRVAPWSERDLDDPIETELEGDVVHELIHVRFWPVDMGRGSGGTGVDDFQDNLHELSIDRTAQALVRLRKRSAE